MTDVITNFNVVRLNVKKYIGNTAKKKSFKREKIGNMAIYNSNKCKDNLAFDVFWGIKMLLNVLL